MKNKCKCGAEFDGPDDPIWNRLMPFCPECSKVIRDTNVKEQAERTAREQEMQWQKLCPLAYRNTAVDKLPIPDKADEILAWNYGAKGLMLYGPTRRGKTRCAWLQLKKMFKLGKSIKVLDALAGFNYMAEFSNGGEAAREWVESYCRCEILFLDDVFKAKLTDSFEAAIFAIIDYRMSHNLPILATLNDTGETLTARMSSDRGDAMVARLKEMCNVIQF